MQQTNITMPDLKPVVSHFKNYHTVAKGHSIFKQAKRNAYTKL